MISGIAQTDSQILTALEREIRAQAEEGYEHLDMERFIALSPWSRRQTERRFRDRYLTSPARYFRDLQTEVAGRLLAQGDDVLSASARAGFASPGRLHDAIVVRYGLTPGELRRRAAGVHIDFGFFKTQVGIVLMAATARGLCMLSLCGAFANHEDLARKIDALRTAYPQAELEEAPEKLQRYADQLVAFLDARSPEFLPPVDVMQGTTFQREVWAELQKIRPGETASYSEIAARIGHPKAFRAVANACACNPVAIAIPCHRIVRSDGTLAGYAWGIDWKMRLLEIEAEIRTHHAGAEAVSAN